ncbi:MAG TPA: PHP-associated domain-containing protein, partial [Thermomicrobiales bacterium]|nr:PHP-associated domain-containing protein [Thermomicrobiales bacterium]
NRTATIERVAGEYDLAVLGGSDAHLTPGQIGGHATLFPGETVQDLLLALHQRRTQAVTLPRPGRIPKGVYALQSVYSWLLPFQGVPGISTARAGLLRRARAAAQRGGRRTRVKSPRGRRLRREVRVS